MAMEMKEHYEAFFREADKDNSNYLDLNELVAMLRKRGYTGSDGEIKQMFHAMDTSGDNLVSLDEFMVAMGARPSNFHNSACMRAVFRTFDKDGNGEIDASELKTAFADMGKFFSDAEIQRMMELMDTDKSGTISYEEFIAKMFGPNAPPL